MKYVFIVNAPQSTQTLSGGIWEIPIFRLNRAVWNLDYVQTNDLCYTELLEMELLEHLTMSK